MSLLRCLLPFVGLIQFAPAQEPAVDRSGDRLLVCNKAEHTLSIFAPLELRELAVIPTGRGPHEVAVAPDGRTAVVSDYGEQKPGHSLTVVDVVAAAVLRTVDLAIGGEPGDAEGQGDKKYLRPHGVQFVDAHHVVVTSETSRRLLLVDIVAGRVERTWTTPQPSMHMVSVTRDGRRAAATSIVDGTVAFFALADAGDPVPTAVPTGEGAEGLAVHPTSGEAWVGNRAANSLSVVDSGTRRVVATLPTGAFPFRVAFTPDGTRALVTCAESGELQIFDAARRELAAEVSMHGDRSEQSSLPLGVVSDPEGDFAYVTCARGEFVAVIDLRAGRFVDRMPARKGPDGIAYARPVGAAIRR